MEVDHDPRLDMSLDELIKQSKKDTGKGGGAPRGRGGRGGQRGRGGRGGPRTATAVRAENSQKRGTDGRQAKLAEKRGLAVPVGQGASKPGRGGKVKARAVPLHGASASRTFGQRGRGGIRVGTRGGRGGSSGSGGSFGNIDRIKITIDNSKAFRAPQFSPQTQMYPAHVQQAPVMPAWGSAMYTGAPQAPSYQPQFRPGTTAPYVAGQPTSSWGGGRAGGGTRGGTMTSPYQGMGRGSRGVDSQAAGRQYVNDNPYGSYSGKDVGGRGAMRMNSMPGGISHAPTQMTRQGLRF